MASEEHLRIIERGVETWNAWREENHRIQPDLAHIVFRGADLSGAELSGTSFAGADLSGANLSAASLVRSDLNITNLSRANLTGATLELANLNSANLVEANLSGTNLSFAGFNLAVLKGAQFTDAKFKYTAFASNDLSEVIGLETVQHLGPSSIGVDTLFWSGGKIPEVFLRGAGVPDNLITFLPSLIGHAIEFYSCFISYSHADKSFARRLHDALQGRGIRCWLDEHELLPGDKIYTEIDRGIRLWDKVLLCCSRDSLTSWWVDNELKIAFDKEQQLWRERKTEVLALIPVNLDDYLFSGEWKSGLATEVKARVAANFVGWENDNKNFEEQFQKVVRSLQLAGGGKKPPPQRLL